MFQIGDTVIKKDGGNKMIINEIKNDIYSCIWATDKVHSGNFKEEEIIKLSTWNSLMHQMERNDKINEVLRSD